MKQICLGIIGILLFIYACNNDLKTIGQDMINNGNYIGEDNLVISQMSTIRIDSFVTSSGIYSETSINEIIAGKYTDEYGGTTTAVPCFQISPTYRPSISIHAALDSVTFHIRYGGKIWGDTIFNPKIQKFNLFRLSALPEFDYDKNGYFYNTTKVNTEEEPIGTTEFLPKRANINRAYFRVDDELANTLFEKIKFREDDDIYEPNATSTPFLKFLQYFKGLAIVPDEENNCLISFSALADSLYMQFNYKEGGTDRILRFPLAQKEYQYNSFQTNPAETGSDKKPFEALYKQEDEQEDEVSFEDAGNIALAQGLSGYMIKLTLPNPLLYPSYTTIIKAQLEIKPEYFSNNPIQYAKQVIVYTTDDLNRITGYLQNSSTSNVIGTLQLNDQNSNENRYIFDLTEYYQRMLSQPPSAKEQQILISIPNLSLSYDYMIAREMPIVKIYYANYKQ